MNYALNRFVRLLTDRTRLTAEECDAIISLKGKERHLHMGARVARVGDPISNICLVVEGICGRVHTPRDDMRQITAVYVCGEAPDLHCAFEPRSSARLEALTNMVLFDIPREDLSHQMAKYPALTEAFARHLLADAQIADEWIANIGGREARKGLAHLFCELAIRTTGVSGNAFSYPLL